MSTTKETKSTHTVSLTKIESLTSDKVLKAYQAGHSLEDINLESGATARQISNAITDIIKAEDGIKRAEGYIEEYSKPVPMYKTRTRAMADYYVESNQLRFRQHQIKLAKASQILKNGEFKIDLDVQYADLYWKLRVLDLEFIKKFSDHTHAKRMLNSLEKWETKRIEEGRTDLPEFSVNIAELTPMENEKNPEKEIQKQVA